MVKNKQRKKKAAPGTDRRPVDLDLIKPLSSTAVLLEVTPVSVGASAEPNIAAAREDEVAHKLRYRAELIDDDQGESDIIAVWLEFEYEALGADQETVADVDCEFVVSYRLAGATQRDFTAEQLNLFAEINGIYNVWPYMREAVTSLGARIGLPRVILPLWRPPTSLPEKGEFETLLRPATRG